MKSIRVKLWLGMMVLVGTIILLLWLFQIVFLEKFYSFLEVNEITNNAYKIIKEIGTTEDTGELNITDKLISQTDDYIYKKQLTVEVIDTSYKIIYRGSSGYNKAIPGIMKEAAAIAVENALMGKEYNQKVIHPKFGYQFMIIGLPIKSNNKMLGAMLVTMPMAAVEDTADLLKKQLIFIIGILLFVSIFLSYHLSKRFTAPILMISKQAESYTSGQFLTRINDMEDDEIGQLAKRMNEMGDALMKNEVLQKEIIANVSHELRTPLTLIRGYAETLRDVTGENPDKRKKHLAIIVEETERLSNIVEDILNLSQLQSGTQPLQIESFSLKEMLMKMKTHYEIQEEAKSFQIDKAMGLQENLLGDQKKIEQVLYNLIDNAFRHSNVGDMVEITVKQNLNRVRIEVTDHGEGISQEDLEHIFERYYRGKRTDGKKVKGTGLGLAIVKSIMELQQMPYGVNSELGKGATFWFELKKDTPHTSGT